MTREQQYGPRDFWSYFMLGNLVLLGVFSTLQSDINQASLVIPITHPRVSTRVVCHLANFIFKRRGGGLGYTSSDAIALLQYGYNIRSNEQALTVNTISTIHS